MLTQNGITFIDSQYILTKTAELHVCSTYVTAKFNTTMRPIYVHAVSVCIYGNNYLEPTQLIVEITNSIHLYT